MFFMHFGGHRWRDVVLFVVEFGCAEACAGVRECDRASVYVGVLGRNVRRLGVAWLRRTVPR